MAATRKQGTTVVDITYCCNAACKYCQWGRSNNRLQRHLSLDEILVSGETINALGTTRIVLSGGEPRLHPQLSEILAHYRKYVDSLIVLTNGYGLDRSEILNLKRMGATGVTVSLDSILSKQSMQTKETPLISTRKL